MKKFYFTFGLIIYCLSISYGQLYEVPFQQKVEKYALIVEGKATRPMSRQASLRRKAPWARP